MKYLIDYEVDGWELTEIKTDRQEVLFYYKVNSSKTGFYFKVLEFSEQTIGEDVKYEILFDGVAYYDGLRHLTVGEGDDISYLHYCDPNCLSLIFDVVANLEKEYCGSL